MDGSAGERGTKDGDERRKKKEDENRRRREWM
jgi:hypothetical protein